MQSIEKSRTPPSNPWKFLSGTVRFQNWIRILAKKNVEKSSILGFSKRCVPFRKTYLRASDSLTPQLFNALSIILIWHTVLAKNELQHGTLNILSAHLLITNITDFNYDNRIARQKCKLRYFVRLHLQSFQRSNIFWKLFPLTEVHSYFVEIYSLLESHAPLLRFRLLKV